MLLKNVLTYSGSSYLGQLLSLVEGVVLRRLLPPAAMGVWELALVIQSLVTSVDPGVGAAARFELPQLDGAGERAEERRVRSTTLRASLVLALLQSAGVLAYTFGALWATDEVASGVACALIVVPGVIASVFQTFLQGAQRFVSLSKMSLAYSALTAILLPLGALAGGGLGLLCAGVAVSATQPVLLYAAVRAERLDIRNGWSTGTLRRLMQFGLPLRFVDAPQALLTNLDTLLVSRLLGLGPLALYAIAKSCFLQAVAVSGPAWGVFMMRVFHLTGARRERSVVADEARIGVLVQHLIVSPILVTLMVPAYTFLVTRFMPAYEASIPVIKILALSIYFLPQATQIRNFWMLDRRLAALGVSNLVGLGAMGGGIALMAGIHGATLESIAGGSLLGYLGYYVWVMATLGRELWGGPAAIRLVLQTLLSLVVTAGAVSYAPAVHDADVLTQLAQLAWAATASLFAVSPLVLYGLWRTQALRYVRRDLGWSAG